MRSKLTKLVQNYECNGYGKNYPHENFHSIAKFNPYSRRNDSFHYNVRKHVKNQKQSTSLSNKLKEKSPLITTNPVTKKKISTDLSFENTSRVHRTHTNM